jgi:hypothetical protein
VGDVDRDWAALRSRLEPRRSAAPRANTRGLQRWAHWWPVAVGFQCAVVLGLVIALVIAVRQPEPYRALGAGASAPVANALVVFRPDATEAQIRAALRASGARLVGGPTVTNAYLLQMPEPGPDALNGLRAAAVLRVDPSWGTAAMKAWIAAWFACCMAVGVALAQPQAPAGGDATTRQQVLVLRICRPHKCRRRSRASTPMA